MLRETRLEVETVPTSELVPYAGNAKLHDDWQVEQIARSMEEFGNCDPIGVWHNADGEIEVVEGHGRLMALEMLGVDEAPVIFLDHLTDEQRRAYALVHNQLTMNSGFDEAILSGELDAIADIDMSAFGFDPEEDLPDPSLEELEDADVDEDEMPDDGDQLVSEGDVWRLGDHLIACGDSGGGLLIDEVMGGELADLLLTDPPYNVAVGSITRAGSNANNVRIANDDMSEEDFVDFLSPILADATGHMRDGAAFYIWYAGLHHSEFWESVRRVGRLRVSEQLVWVKSHFVLGRNSDYQWMHECCLYGWKDGAAHYFVPSRSQMTVYEDVPLSTLRKGELIELCERLMDADGPKTVLRADKPATAEMHPTVKPQSLLAPLIRNSTKAGDLVLDPFGGSGSTLIACEQMGRRARLVELDPHYVAVTIRRWEQLTGEAAELLNGDR